MAASESSISADWMSVGVGLSLLRIHSARLPGMGSLVQEKNNSEWSRPPPSLPSVTPGQPLDRGGMRRGGAAPVDRIGRLAHELQLELRLPAQLFDQAGHGVAAIAGAHEQRQAEPIGFA